MLPPDGIVVRVQRATILPAWKGGSKHFNQKQSQNGIILAIFSFKLVF